MDTLEWLFYKRDSWACYGIVVVVVVVVVVISETT
jgi:t-SNARE complex subunit (syntaxin)